MPNEAHIEHQRITDLRIPYRSFDSPTSSDIMWQDGRNCYSNSKGYLERRPGFGATVEPVPTTFGKVQRIFTWAKWAIPGVPGHQASDIFNRADGTLIDGNWYKPSSYTYAVELVGQRLRAPKAWSGHVAGAHWATPMVGADQWAEIRYANPQDGYNTSGWKGVKVRANEAGNTYYYACVNNTETRIIRIGRVVNGTLTEITNAFNISVEQGDWFGLKVVGNQLTVLKNGVATANVKTDNTITDGDYIGIHLEGQIGNTDYCYFDDFRGGDFGVADIPAGYHIMISSLENGVSTVWKFKIGSDQSAVKIFTSSSDVPFDFLEANNHCFFGNGTDMMKYDGSTVTKWGIERPSAAPTLTAGSGYVAGTADTAEGVYYCYSYGNSNTGHESSTSPVTGKVVPGKTTTADTTKMSLSGPVTAYVWGDSPHEGPTGLYIWKNPTDTGTGTDRTIDTATLTMFGSSLLFDPAGTGKQETPVQWTTFDDLGKQTGTQTLFQPALQSQGYSDFNVCVVAELYVPAAGSYDFTVRWKDDILWGIGGGATWSGTGSGPNAQTKTVVGGYPLMPRTALSSGLGGIQGESTVTVTFPDAGLYPIEIDWDYWYHSGRILTVKCNGQDIKPVIVKTDIEINNSIGLLASSDTQVDKIHVYRTTYGGSYDPSKMQELPNSPYANSNATIEDTALDTDLQLSYAPGHYSNDPPPPSKGFVWSQQRVWCFKRSTLYYSGYEELIKGVPEESFPSSADGNWRPYKREIHALAPMSNGISIMTSLTQYGVDGDTLDTFRWGTLLEKRGTISNTLVTSVGSTILWGDTSAQIWNSDSGEIGLDIRPDLKGFTPPNSQLITHIADEFHWVLFLDSDRQKLWVHNLDTEHWQVPWTVNATALHSGETADGVVDLMIGLNGTTLCKLTPNTFTDNGTAYDAWIRTNQFDLCKVAGQSAAVDYVEIERNSIALTGVLQANDENTHRAAAYTSIFGNEINPPQRGQGTDLIAKRYMSQPTTMNTGASACKRASFEFRWGTNANKFELYSIDIAYHPAVAR